MKEENMREIRVLDSSTIDKIAAGEVVERPASVVKELVENAMDSHASAITVEIRDGGIGLIRVTDDGDGIEKSQVSKAFYRHATSKIQTAEDLTRVMSLGFRGEALSSICAVAQVEMITRTKDALTGIRYVIEGGAEKSSEEIGAPEGTTVIVRNLFFNVPARRKFLKTAQSEAGHVADLMEHLALSHPSVSFKLMINGQLKFHTTGNGDRREIVYRIYGRDIAGELVPIEREENGYHVNGLLGTPVIGRANRNFEHTFINGRYIKSAVIAKAAEDGYKPYLMQHKYPFFLLDIRMEPDMLDVNVHPAKMEVRFHQRMTVSDFIYRAVSDVLSGKEMIKEVKLSEKEDREAERVQRRELERVPVPEPFEKTARLLKESHEKEERLREEPLCLRLLLIRKKLLTLENLRLQSAVLFPEYSERILQTETLSAEIRTAMSSRRTSTSLLRNRSSSISLMRKSLQKMPEKNTVCWDRSLTPTGSSLSVTRCSLSISMPHMRK